ncbi:hypothetical protein [Desulfurispora thermophila]|uniref:hypothetical protein n=1 Tax=Desulfurispora thermophila TaxID=265470 RepID=UPI0012EA6EB7|nr:hypothetical protein [Desulfurispora thermophila]
MRHRNGDGDLDLGSVISDLTVMLEGIASDFYRHRAHYLTQVQQISHNTVNTMKKKVLKVPLVKGETTREAAGKYEVMRDMEYIRLNLLKVMQSTENKVNQSVLFSKWAVDELTVLIDGAKTALRELKSFVERYEVALKDKLVEYCGQMIDNCAVYSKQHQQRFDQGICTPQSADIYQAMLDAFRDIFRHVKSCAIKLGSN